MQSKRSRLDRFLCKKLNLPQKSVRILLINNRVKVDRKVTTSLDLQIDEFNHIQFDDNVLQDKTAIYLMMNKPVGVVSATKDAEHSTVIDLLTHSQKNELHIAGRLDLNSSGLILLTNDSRWSKGLMSPENKVDKVYRVTLADPISSKYIEGFRKGFYFEYENVTTKPAALEIIGEREAIVTLSEGKYHQIKRMFGRYRNAVVGLHRLSIGGLYLDRTLEPSQSRELSELELLKPLFACPK
ncbi:pseudouridine synthase [Parashewanella spongiae]|uniref:Pseudouridine synthase n=1 Tax=Parashewanella spongiae TaxID=342950 RepID=A0A3A6U7W6_9GAMM|nr:16S rRNA pseudouridine(516) synthase [Parashewanella spongiae]MCL1077812.1 pseudouridine synthase [Parashewanella spongiae]RJY18012.1 pseudouridine synthase [Parashewanella spongiae]